MATRFVFSPLDAEFPTSNFPALLYINNRPVLAFDASTDETCYFSGKVPQGWTGTITLILTYMMASATSGAVGMQAQVESVSDGDATDLDAGTSFDTVNNSASTTVPGTAGYIDEISITLTNNDSSAAGDSIRFAINRDADGSAITDNATGDLYLTAVEIRDGA